MQCNGRLPLLGAQEVSTVSQEHVFHTRLKNDGAHRPFLPSAIPPPTPICTEQMNEFTLSSGTEGAYVSAKNI